MDRRTFLHLLTAAVAPSSSDAVTCKPCPLATSGRSCQRPRASVLVLCACASNLLSMNATYASNEFTRRVDGSSTFSQRIPRVKIEYQVARSVFVRIVSQYEANRRETLVDYRTGLPLLVRQSNGTYAQSVARASNLLRADWLFSYRPSPGTVFFAGYGNSMTEPEALGFDRLRRVSDGFFLKASWLFTPPVAR